MRKWNLLTAAFLLSVGAVTVTSCLDNEEPTGIQEMRTAKAELYKAQAALQTAEIGIKEADAKLKLAEVAQKEAVTQSITLGNQMLELQVAIKKAQSDAEIARLTNEKTKYELQLDSIQEAHKVTMLEAQEATAKAQHNYDQALKELAYLKGKVNDTYAGRLETVVGKLTTAMGNITDYKNQIMDKERELLIFSAKNDNDYISARLNANVADKEADLASAEKTLADYKDVYGTPVSEWEAKGEKLLASLDSLQVMHDTLEMRKARLENTEVPWNEKLTALNRQMTDPTEALEVTIPREIQPIFFKAVQQQAASYVWYQILNFIEYDVTQKGYVLKNGDQLKIEKLSLNELMNLISNYNALTNIAQGLVISDEDNAQASEHLKTLKGNMEDQAAIYNTESKTWEKLRDQYIKDKDAYLLNQQYDLRSNTIVDVQSFYKSEKKAADKDALVTSLKNYYKVRAALDGTKPTYYNGTETKIISEALSVDNLEAILTETIYDQPEYLSNYTSLLGSELKINRDDEGKDIVYGYVNKEAGSQGAFYDQCRSLWGVYENSNQIIIRYTPITEQDYQEGTYQINTNYLTDYEPVAYLMFKNAEVYNIFKSKYDNKDKYNTLYNDFLAIYDKTSAKLKALQEERASYQKEIENIEAQITLVSREQSDLTTKRSTYQNILNVIAGYYSKDELSYEAALAQLKTSISAAERNIITAQQNLKEAKAMLEAWNKGKDVDANEGLGLEAVTSYINQLNSDIEVLQEKLAHEQKQFDTYTAEKNALMEVLVGESYK